MKAALALVAVLPAIVTTTPAVAQNRRVATHLLTHNRIEITRPAATIWPFILKPQAWKQGLQLVHQSGPAGRVGEVFAAVEAANPTRVMLLVENVELVPNERRTIKLLQPDGRLAGFATWTLDETGGRTVVGYDVYSETVLPADQAAKLSAAAVAELERSEHNANFKRFDAELAALKGLVERR